MSQLLYLTIERNCVNICYKVDLDGLLQGEVVGWNVYNCI